MSLAKSKSGAFFTSGGYLSINRDYVKELLNDDHTHVDVEGQTFNLEILLSRITYNEHKNVMRWDSSHYKLAKD